MTILRSGSASDVGQVRTVNQDAVIETVSLYAVADGMGGAAGGEVASRIALESLTAAYSTMIPSLGAVRRAVEAANAAVYEAGHADRALAGMGTTLTVVAPVEDEHGADRVVIANVGDSRCYLFANRELRQLTRDHSIAAELVRAGELTEAEAEHHPQRHLLTRVLGVDPEVQVDLFELPVVGGDRLLVCSDGLSNEVTSQDLAQVLATVADPGEAARALVQTANAHGGRDNVTVLIVDVLVGDDGAQARDLDALAPLATSGPLDHGAEDVTGTVPIVRATVPRSSTQEVPVVGDGPPVPGSARLSSGAYAAQLTVADVTPVRRPRLISIRSVLFLALLIGVGALAYGFVEWFAKTQYFVALDGQTLVVYQGQVGGTLWVKPKVVERSAVTTAMVLHSRVPALAAGVAEPSLSAARGYIANLRAEYDQQQAALAAPTTSTTTTTLWWQGSGGYPNPGTASTTTLGAAAVTTTLAPASTTVVATTTLPVPTTTVAGGGT